MNNILITGGLGFIGSHFAKYWAKNYPRDKIIIYDAFTYASDPSNIENVCCQVINGDIGDYRLLKSVLKTEEIDLVVNFAAESHNSRGVTGPLKFYQTNVVGTATLMQACVECDIARVHHISTCEVYGDLDFDSPEEFYETSPYHPNTPYSSSKAGADMLVRAYHHTYGLPITISNCCNNYGTHQHPEKVIPRFICAFLMGDKLPVYRDIRNMREWISVEDHCEAIDFILKNGKIGETYNVGTGVEFSVFDIVKLVLRTFGIHNIDDYIEFVKDRPGNDRRYLLNSDKLKSMGWSHSRNLVDDMHYEIKNWYWTNKWWWEKKYQILIDERKW